jgi:hypothetical protein
VTEHPFSVGKTAASRRAENARQTDSLQKHNLPRRNCGELLSYIDRCSVRREQTLEERNMRNANRAVAAVTAAAIALTTAGVAPAFAASKRAPDAQSASTDFSSHRYRGHRYRNNAAGAAAFAAIIGGIATYAAAREYRKSRERAYYNGYYGQPYGYYGGGYYRPHYGW